MKLLVGTTAGAFLVDDTTEQVLGATRINHLVRDGDDWWAVDGSGRLTRNGEVVVTMPSGVTPLCLQPTPETIWVGADKARLFAVEGSEVAADEFFAQAPGRETWHTPWGGPPDVRSMTLDADHTLYINVHVGGILRYDDTGPVPTLDIDADVHQVAAHPTQQGAIFAATARGLAASHNGHDFEFRGDGLHAGYCRAVAVGVDHLLLSASTGPRTDRGRLYRGELWEGPLERVDSGLPEWFDSNVDTYCVQLEGSAAHVGHRDTVWRSEDAGRTWEVLTRGLPVITCLA